MRAKAGPRIVFRQIAEPALHRIAVDVSKLGDEARRIANVVIEIAGLPKRRLAVHAFILFSSLDRYASLEGFHGFCDRSARRLTDQQVNMLRHYDITEYEHVEAVANLFEGA